MNPYSNLKIFHHHEILEAIENSKPIAPVYIRIKPTNVCNHHCAYCSYGSGDTNRKTSNRDSVEHRDTIPWERMISIIEDMGKMGVKAVTLSGGGEPLTYPYICETMDLFCKNNIETSLISNGELLTGKIAERFYDSAWVRISFDSPEKEEYCRLRGLSFERFDRVVDNISSFAQNKSKNCILGINFVVSKANYKNVYKAAEFLKELGVDNVKYAAMVDNYPGYHRDINDCVIEQIHRAKDDFEDDHFGIINNYEFDYADKNLTEQPFSCCYTCRFITVIAADSKVYLCHTRAYDKGAVLGSVMDRRFKQLWFSDEVQERLKTIEPKKECKNFCAYESRNVLLNDYYNSTKHLNFI